MAAPWLSALGSYDAVTGPHCFCQAFFRAIHNFFSLVPFRLDNRARLSEKTSFWAPWARSIRRAQAASFTFVYALSVGSVKALPAVFSGALLAVFK